MSTTTEKEITVADGLGNADASQVLAGATFSSEEGFNIEGTFVPSAVNIAYDNTTSGMASTNVQGAIDEISETASNLPSAGTKITGVLSAGQTTVTLTSEEITSNTKLNAVYTSIYGVSLKSATFGEGTLTLEFPVQEEDMTVMALIDATVSSGDNMNDGRTTANKVSYDNSTSGLSATNVQGAIDSNKELCDTALAIANGRNQALAYTDYSEMITALNSMGVDELKRGQNLYIGTVGVPDLWVYSVEENNVAYTYVDDDTIVNALDTNTTIQVGYYKLAQLETQKVDLTNIESEIDALQTSDTDINALITALTNRITELENASVNSDDKIYYNLGSYQLNISNSISLNDYIKSFDSDSIDIVVVPCGTTSTSTDTYPLRGVFKPCKFTVDTSESNSKTIKHNSYSKQNTSMNISYSYSNSTLSFSKSYFTLYGGNNGFSNSAQFIVYIEMS